MNRSLDTLTTADPATLSAEALRRREDRTPRLEILFHYDLRRIGMQSAEDLFLQQSRGLVLGRDTPLFHHPNEGGGGKSLEDPCISRHQMAIWWRPEHQAFEVQPSPKARLQTRALVRTGEDPDTPYDVQELNERTWLKPGSCLMLGNRTLILLSHKLQHKNPPPRFGMVGESEQIWNLRQRVRTIGCFQETVLLLGETGSGKEMVARALHEASGAKGAFIAINMSSLNTHLADSDLFGHEKGAFTGAADKRLGAFRKAEGGTLFLDEIGDVSLEIQKKLLRALEAHIIEPLGAKQPVEVNVRVVAATNRALTTAIERGEFRKDLFERLRALTIAIAPLRQRREDIPLLFAHFLRQQTNNHSSLERLWVDELRNNSPPVPLRFILQHLNASWSGNVRELKNMVASVAVANLNQNTFVTPESFSDSFLEPSVAEANTRLPTASTEMQALDREGLLDILKRHNFNQSHAAKELGVARQTLIQWMDNAGLRRAKDIGAEEIQQTLKKHQGDLGAAAMALLVSPRALRLRLRGLGLSV